VQDRTKFLLGEISQNPGEGMAHAVAAIRAAAEKTGNVAVVAVPCNTFHAPKIWNHFVEKLKEHGADGSILRLVHMLDETVKLIKEVAPAAKKIGLMSTTGTRQVRDCFFKSICLMCYVLKQVSARGLKVLAYVALIY
jgi:aspartate racemase